MTQNNTPTSEERELAIKSTIKIYRKMANERLIMLALSELLANFDTGGVDIYCLRSALSERATEANSINMNKKLAEALIQVLMVRPGRKAKKK